MTSDTYNLVRQAIVNKQQVIATYKGLYRGMCPHVIGLTDGHEQAFFYQFAGTSSSGLRSQGARSNWRCIPIAGLTNVSVRDGEWHTEPPYAQHQTCVDVIDKEAVY